MAGLKLHAIVMSKKYQIPDPEERSPKAPALVVTGVRILNIYNNVHRKKPKVKLGEKVRQWFVKEALAKGWTAAMEVKAVGGKHSYAVLLFRSPTAKPQVQYQLQIAVAEMPTVEG